MEPCPGGISVEPTGIEPFSMDTVLKAQTVPLHVRLGRGFSAK